MSCLKSLPCQGQAAAQILPEPHLLAHHEAPVMQQRCLRWRVNAVTPTAPHPLTRIFQSLLPAGVPFAGAPRAPRCSGGGLGAGGSLGVRCQLRRQVAADRQARQVRPRRRAHKLQAAGLALFAALLLALLLKLGRQPGTAAALSAQAVTRLRLHTPAKLGPSSSCTGSAARTCPSRYTLPCSVAFKLASQPANLSSLSCAE